MDFQGKIKMIKIGKSATWINKQTNKQTLV